MFSSILLLFATTFTTLSSAASFPDPLVTLPSNGLKLQGKYSEAYNVTYFRRIPFAAPPVGQNRFRGPQPWTGEEGWDGGVYNSDRSFDMCVQRTVNGTEDCLYLAVYSRPFNATASKKPKLRPVMLFYYGGGFIQGNVDLTLPPMGFPTLNVAKEIDYVAVYSNYRTNAFGLLPGRRVKQDKHSDLNPGLLDQQATLKWIRENIAAFGGDKDDVTIMGQSAGGGSVVAQVIANGGDTKPQLFKNAILSSPFWPKFYRYNDPEAEEIYDTLANLTGCAAPEVKDSLQCLKTVDVQKIRDANQIINSMRTSTTSSFTWSPVIDGTFLPYSLASATSRNKINGENVFAMFNRFEGSSFVSSGYNTAPNGTDASFTKWVHAFLPDVTDATLEKIRELYPDIGEGNDEYTTVQDRAGFAYRDIVLTCPGYWLASSASQKKGKGKGYVGEYVISPAKHASDTGYWNRIGTLQTTSPITYHGYAGAFASFIQKDDPNYLKNSVFKAELESFPDTPEVGSVKRWIVDLEKFGTEDNKILAQRCAFWRKVALGGEVEI